MVSVPTGLRVLPDDLGAELIVLAPAVLAPVALPPGVVELLTLPLDRLDVSELDDFGADELVQAANAKTQPITATGAIRAADVVGRCVLITVQG